MSNIDPDGDIENIEQEQQLAGGSSQTDLTNLQENFNQQQAKISALKELVRKSEVDQGKNTANAQEKVRNIAQRLNHLKSKALRSRQSEKSFTEIQEEVTEIQTTIVTKLYENEGDHSKTLGHSTSIESLPTTPMPLRARSETPGSEKIQLLRQQMEQNRLKMAERETNKRGIEQLVTQLKAKFDSSQLSLDRAHQLGSSVGDLSMISGNAPLKHQSTGDLNTSFSLDRERIKYLEKRVRHLETEMKQKENDFLNRDPESEHLKTIKHLEERILDLDENLKEKDDIIDARTQAASLITESLSLKGKDTIDLLEETKQEMFKMQNNFVAVEDELKIQVAKLEKEIQTKDKKIANLEEVNDILETARFDLTLKNSELDSKTGNVEDYIIKLNELNRINETLQHRIETLENEKEEPDNESIVVQATVEQVLKIQELEAQIAELQRENDDLKKSLQSAMNTPATDDNVQDKINALEATIAAQKEECLNLSNSLQNVQDQLTEKTVEYNVLMANFNVLEEKCKSYGPKSLFSKSTDEEAQVEINKLTKQLDDANKTGIKIKLKMKQLQKQIDTFKKASDTNKELVKQSEEIQRLNDKIKELESENLALNSRLFPSADQSCDELDKASVPLELEAKIKFLETACQNQTSAIQLLEEQKLDMSADLNTTKTELTSLKGHIKDIDKQEVTCQIDSIVLEEQFEENLREVEALKQKIYELTAEKTDLKNKLDRYMNENMELLDKIEKLSKGSSAESIEILERLTHDEKLEMEHFQQVVENQLNRSRHGSTTEEDDDVSAIKQNPNDKHPELDSINANENLAKLSQESSLLRERIQIFTAERQEVLEKMNALREENTQNLSLIDDLRAEKIKIEIDCDELKATNLSTIKQLKENEDERQHLLANITEINDIKAKLQDEIDLLSKERSVVEHQQQQSHSIDDAFADPISYKTSLNSLNTELENYRGAKDKNTKVSVSKKLAREAKNLSELVGKLIIDYDRSVEQFVSLKSEMECARLTRESQDKEKLVLMADGYLADPEQDIIELRSELEKYKLAEDDVKQRYEELERQIEIEKSDKDDLKKSLDEITDKSSEIETSLKDENDRLNQQLQQLQSKFSETNEYNFQELQKQRKEYENLVETNKKEVNILRELVDEQKQQLIAAYTEHEDELQEKSKQITLYGQQIEKLQSDLDETSDRMSKANDNYVNDLKQKMESMKDLQAENQKILSEQTVELANKQTTIETLNQQIMNLYATMEHQTAELNEKEEEILQLEKTIKQNKVEIKKMNQTCLASEQRIKDADLLVKQKESEFESIKIDLETKAKEQLEKLKKFAANLKKRNAQFTELEQKYKELESSKSGAVERKLDEINVERRVEAIPLQQSSNNAIELAHQKETIAALEHKINDSDLELQKLRNDIDYRCSELENLKLRLSEKASIVDELTAGLESKNTEIIELRSKISELQPIKNELSTTVEDLKSKNIKIEKCKAVIKEKNKEIKRLQEQIQIVSAQSANDSLKIQIDQLQSEKEKIENDYSTYRTFIETKLQTNELVLETAETENAQLKERIGRLEQNICIAEERRSSLERHSEVLGLQLQQKQSQIEHVEDEYTNRLKTLVGQDEIIEEKLKDLENERDGLLDTVKELKDKQNDLTRRNSLLQNQISDLESTKLLELETDNKELEQKIEKLENDLVRQKQEFEQTVAAKHAELIDLENELSDHLQKVEHERRSIQENLDKSRDANNTLQDEIVRLRDSQNNLEQSRNDLEQEITWIKLQNDTMSHDQMEAQELRMQVVQDQTEVENLQMQNIEMAERHMREINLLQGHLNESKQQLAQSQAEVERLHGEIALIRDDHTRALDGLKSQICHDQTDIVNLRFRNDQLVTDHEIEMSALHQRINELNSLQGQVDHDQNEIESLRMHKQQLESQLVLLRQQMTELDSLQMHVGQNLTQDQMEVQQLRTQINHDQSEIESLRHQVQQLHTNHETELAALRQQIAELESLRMQVGENQTDDQVFIQNENERLQSVLAEKEIEIQNYQRQNLQLQMSSGAGVSIQSAFDPFASLAMTSNTVPDATELVALTARVTDLEHQLETALRDATENRARVLELEASLAVYNNDDTYNLQTKCIDLQRLCNEKDLEIVRLQDRGQNLLPTSESIPFATESIFTAQQIPLLSAALPLEHNSFADHGIGASVDSSPNDALPLTFEHHDQQIEDLQRNVSDLEKYVTDLEHKLKSATEENLKLHTERTNLENHLSIKSKQYEEQVSTLNAQLNAVKEQLAIIETEKLIVHSEAEVVRKPPQQLPNTASIFFGSPSTSDPFDDIHLPKETDRDEQRCTPVVEEFIVPKKAYVCHPQDEQEVLNRQNLSPLSAIQDEGWGDSSWGADAALEEEHQQQTSIISQSTRSNTLSTAETKLQLQIDELVGEKEHLNSELTGMQTKYQKMLKKLREYKTKNDEYEHSKRSSSVETNDLDLAIQEELNGQIKALEQRLKEIKAESEKDGQEKKKLLNRIDVLTAANDRMMEMKDKQDVEIEVCKTKLRELTGKLEKLNEWGDDVVVDTGANTESLSARLIETQNQNRLLEERIARLQDSITDKDDFEEEREQLNEKLQTLTSEKALLDESIHNKDKEIANLTAQFNTLQSQNNDYKATIDILSGESNNIKTYLDRLKDEHKQKIDENNNLSEKLKELDGRNRELAKQVEEMRLYNLSAQDVEQRIQDLNATIQYKDSENAILNEKIECERQSVDQIVQQLKADLVAANETIKALKEEIVRLTSERNSAVQNASLVNAEPAKTEEIATPATDIRELEKTIADLRKEKVQMEEELQVLNDQVLTNLEIEDRIKTTVLELDMKNIEITELKNSLEQFRAQPISNNPHNDEKMIELETCVREKDSTHQAVVDQLNVEWQVVVDQKCSELADSWRQHLETREQEFNLVENDLRQQLANLEEKLTHVSDKLDNDRTNADAKVNVNVDKEQVIDETRTAKETEQMRTMQNALESQEMEIVSLKEQLAIRSAEYARIAASVDPYGERSTSSNMHSLSGSDRYKASDDSNSGQKGNEMDLALYMLHQRDMRCEELTEEVIHLLEERDTLQLKLSNSIRQIEEFKRRTGLTDAATESPESSSNNSPVKPTNDTTDDTVFHATDIDPTSQSQSDNLNLKLSELHNVNHSRDKTLYEDRDQRRRQMSLMQRDVANMPPEAIAELFGPDYNPNTRNTQNPSSMLLNWLWGKSSPNEGDN